uniref:legumain n=1 Tax=Leersia perrieri TaxID=77586 RepID=A0A0D9XPX8_9ORYZ
MAMGVVWLGLLLLMLLQPQVLGLTNCNSRRLQEFLRLPSNGGTKWALLIAGSNGWENYRHQADVCHAYQIMKYGGLKDENIVVMMYDDIAYNPENPYPGIIINHPTDYPPSSDVYAGVPKDYTGDDVNKNNFLAVLLGDQSALTGAGSGKVISSGPDDHIFVFYSDHGGSGVLCMPSGDYLYADELAQALQKKHDADAYEGLVLYVEACESGSMFDGRLPTNNGVYAMTAANPWEDSWATYCWIPPYNDTCLGDLFSVAWMEDADLHKPGETLGQQYEIVKNLTWPASHVSQYGDLDLSCQPLSVYYAADTSTNDHSSATGVTRGRGVDQRDAKLVYLWNKYEKSAEGTAEKAEAWKRLLREMERRSRVDRSVELIGDLLLGVSGASSKLMTRRPAGQPLVDDWDCLKSMVRTFEAHCGPLGHYGMKHMRTFANMCNAAVDHHAMANAASKACTHPVLG